MVKLQTNLGIANIKQYLSKKMREKYLLDPLAKLPSTSNIVSYPNKEIKSLREKVKSEKL